MKGGGGRPRSYGLRMTLTPHHHCQYGAGLDRKTTNIKSWLNKRQAHAQHNAPSMVYVMGRPAARESVVSMVLKWDANDCPAISLWLVVVVGELHHLMHQLPVGTHDCYTNEPVWQATQKRRTSGSITALARVGGPTAKGSRVRYLDGPTHTHTHTATTYHHQPPHYLCEVETNVAQPRTTEMMTARQNVTAGIHPSTRYVSTAPVPHPAAPAARARGHNTIATIVPDVPASSLSQLPICVTSSNLKWSLKHKRLVGYIPSGGI
jgi:hypothetical protein